LPGIGVARARDRRGDVSARAVDDRRNTVDFGQTSTHGLGVGRGYRGPLFSVRRRTAGYQGFGTGDVYHVTADGRCFLVSVIAGEPEAAPPITVITNWTATLR